MKFPSRLTAAAVTVATVGLSVAAVPFAGPAAAINGCTATPLTGPNTGPTSFTVTADPPPEPGFQPGDYVKLIPATAGVATLTNTTGVTTAEATARTFTRSIDTTAAAPGNYTLKVIRPAQPPLTTTESNVCSSPFTLTNPAVSVSDITVNTRAAGSAGVTATIHGTGFGQGATVAFTKTAFGANPAQADPAVSFTPATITTTAITGTLTVGSGALFGDHTLTVTNTNASTATSTCPGAGCLTVTGGPSVASVSPNTVGQGGSRQLVVTGTDFAPGITATVLNGGTGGSPSDSTVPVSAVSFTDSSHITITVAPSSTAATGARGLLVTNSDGGAGFLAGALSVTPRPVISSVSPTSYDQGVVGKVITVTASNLAPDTVLAFAPGSGVTITNTAIAASTADLTVSIDSGATAGAKTLTITNTDGGTSSSQAFSVSNKPVVTSVSPPSALRGTTTSVTISGSNFSSDAVPSTSCSGITVTPTGTPTATSLTADFTIAADAPQSSCDVTVQNGTGATSRGGSGTKTGAFAVATLLVTGTSPATASNTAANSAFQLTVNGAGFATVGTPVVTLIAGPAANGKQPDITADAVTVTNSGSLVATFNLAGIAPTAYSVKVTNPNGDVGSCNGCFTVTGTNPALTSSSPSTVGSGVQNKLIHITGAGFARGGSFTFNQGITVVGDPVYVDQTHYDITINVPGGITSSTPVTVGYTNTDGRSTSSSSILTVAPAPVVSSVSPSGRATGLAADKTITISGSGYQPGATVAISGGDITVGTPNVTATSITVTVNTQNAAVGPRTVTITNPDGGVGAKAAAFSVDAPPTVTGITPNHGASGATGQAVTITGTGFRAGPTISLGSNITASNIVVAADGNSMTASLDLTGAAVGVRNLTVTNADDGTATLNNAYTVVSAPTVASASPSSLGQGAVTRVVTLTGTGFVNGATVAVSGTGVTVGTVTVNSPTSISVPFSVDSAAPLGARNVTVTNPDTGSGACTGCFTVVAKPVVSSVTPNKVATGTASQSVTVAGSGFVAGATLSLGSGVAVSNVVVASPTSITATVSTTGATPGARDVTVTNPDGGAGVLTNGFTVLSTPTVTGISPAALAQGATSADLTITGTNFTPGTGAQAPTVDLGSGITVSNVVATATSIALKATVSLSATTGPRPVTVTNPDGGTASNSSIFSIDPKATITSISPTQMQQGLSGGVITVTGTGFQTGPITATFSGTGITVTSANASSSTAATVNVNVAPSATLGDRDLTLTNSGNKGTATCAGCFKVVSPRPFIVEIDSTSPESGSTHTVTITAKQSSAAGSPTDTTYTGVPVLSSTDSHFTPGSCSAAVSGVSSCTGVVFGDLGPMVLTALGQGGDSDRGGTVNVTVDAIALEFVSPPSSGTAGQPVSFSVRPVAGVANAVITAYSRPRVLTTTGGTSSPASGSQLSCTAATCPFSVTWAIGGTKSVSVSDGHTGTPTATVVLPVSSRLTCAISRSVVIYGDYQTLSGTLRGVDGQVGSQLIVAIFARTAPATSMSLVRNVRTTSDGRWATTFRMPRNTVFQARFAGSSALNPSTSTSVPLTVRSKVSVTSRPTTVVHGRAFTIKGAVRPATSGLLVWLQYYGTDRAWHSLASSRTTSYGTYAVTASKGVGVSKRWYRVVVARSATNALGLSSGFVIKAT